jgi:predicted amidohydrolase
MTKAPWNPRRLTIALAQFAMAAEPDENLERAVHYIREAAAKGATVVCLPELFRSLYFCNEERCERDYAEEVPGKVGDVLSAEARRGKIAVVGGSVYERAASGQLFNTSLVYNAEGKNLGMYRKVHIPHDPAFFEKNYFTPGDLGYKVFDIGVAKIGVLICYDQWFPEAARTLALMGAEVIFYPTAIARVESLPQVEGDWQSAWEQVQRGHAVANNVIVCPVNRVGTEKESTFWGGSFICDAFGKLLAKGSDAPELVVAEVDVGHSEYTRNGWRFFQSRRPETYGAIVDSAYTEREGK